MLLSVVALIFFAHYILEWWNKDKSLARKQLNDGVAILTYRFGGYKAKLHEEVDTSRFGI